MHTVTEVETNVPAFLAKLWKLVEDPETDDLICWSANGRSFFIRNQAQFARELLPHYYKHNNMASFVRQLNMYGFHKKVSVELGGLKCDRDEMEFAHQYFVKGHSYLLEHIKRKIASNKSQDTNNSPMKPEVMNKVLSEVRTMRGRQEHLDTRLGAMKRENEALWRELAMLRRKHHKQQEIVNKLIHFLVTLVQPTRSGGLPVKRRYPLMIDDITHPRNKQSKMSKPEASPTGPVIHELDASEHDLDSEYIDDGVFEHSQAALIQSPESQDLSAMEDEAVELIGDAIHKSQEVELAKSRPTATKRKLKGKKKEETLMLEVSPEEEAEIPIVLMDPEPTRMKPVPIRTVRSSKLAAMAANINKMNDGDEDADRDSSEEADAIEASASNADPVSLEDILELPEVSVDPNDEENVDDPDGSGDIEQDNEDTSWMNMKGTMNYKKATNDSGTEKFSAGNSGASGCTETVGGNNGTSYAGSTSKSKDLSLSCLNQSGISGVECRLGSLEDMDCHLESMQTELENLREVLRGEGYSIDANTLLGLFGADDPMSFGIPVNPELDPHPQRERDEERMPDISSYASGGGELMAYNSPGVLDFDDEMFLNSGENAAPGENTQEGNYYNTDLLDFEDNKASLLASLVAASESKPSTPNPSTP